MDAILKKAYDKLKKVREDTELEIRNSTYLRDKIVLLDGREIEFKLRYYQAQMVVHLLTMKRFVVGDDTGLGKTLEAIATLCYLWESKPNKKVIVMTNKSVVGQWASEFDKFTEGVTTYQIKGTKKKRQKQLAEFWEHEDTPAVAIMGYRSACSDFEIMQDWTDFNIVFDVLTEELRKNSPWCLIYADDLTKTR